MRRNFKVGLIFAMPLLVLLPIHAIAQMSWSNLTSSLEGAGAGTSMGSITAPQDATITFDVKSTSPLLNIRMITPPVVGASNSILNFPDTTTGAGTFFWDTSSTSGTASPPGSYVAVFESDDGAAQVQYLIAMIKIVSSTGSTPIPAEKITVSFLDSPTGGASGEELTFTVNNAASDLSQTDTFKYNFIWGDGTQTGFQDQLSAGHAFITSQTEQTFYVKVQAKCNEHGVTGTTASVPVVIKGTGTGGEYTNQVLAAIRVENRYLSGANVIKVPLLKGGTDYFLISPREFGIPWARTTLSLNLIDDDNVNYAALRFEILELDSNNNKQGTWPMSLGTGGTYTALLKSFTLDKYNSGVKFLVKVVEPGVKATTLNVYWK